MEKQALCQCRHPFMKNLNNDTSTASLAEKMSPLSSLLSVIAQFRIHSINFSGVEGRELVG
jgi:hypothetical protein